MGEEESVMSGRILLIWLQPKRVQEGSRSAVMASRLETRYTLMASLLLPFASQCCCRFDPANKL